MLPNQSEVELPLLQVLDQLGGKASPRAVYPMLTKLFAQITPDDLAERLSHGEVKWHNRIQWVRQRLVEAGDVESGGRGIWVITSQGRQRLAGPKSTQSTPDRTPTFLESFDAYELSFRNKLLERLLSLTPRQFEHFGQRLMIAYGFSDVEVTGVSRDGGIDGYGRLALGLATLNAAFQCKRWQGNIGRPEVDKFRGAIQGNYEQVLFFTTSDFTPEAKSVSLRSGAVPIVLFNGQSIVRMMIERQIGVERIPLHAYQDVLDEELGDTVE